MLGRAVLGRYRVVRVLAHGGMGVLYLGRTEGAAGFSRPVVIKRILPHLVENPRMAGLFVREARILSELQHPGIVNILDFGEEDGAYVMVLEFVKGYDLGLWHRFLRETGGLFTGDVALQVLIKVLDALHHAHTFVRPDGHALGIVHRDVSPGNVLLDTDGHVKLLDFGIARFSDDAGEYRTREGEFKGKAAYTAPEIFRGAPASVQSDVFAAGVVLYKILAGFNPFEGETSMQTVKRIAEMEPSPVSHVRTDLRRELDPVLARALAKEPSQRYRSAAEFAEALRRCRRQGDEAAQARLVADIQRDFLGDMPGVMGIEPLPTLDAAWRAPNTQELRALVDTNETGLPTPTPSSPSPEAPPRKPRKVAVMTLAGLTLGLVVAAGAFGFLSRPSARTQAPASFVVIEKAPELPAPVPAEAPPEEERPLPSPSLDQPEKGASERKRSGVQRPTTPNPRALTSAFRKQQGKIERCFETHAALVEGAPEIAVAFNVSAEGRVASATVVPENLTDTPLGTCLLGIARTTNFGVQSAPLAFRIPLRARQAADER